MFPSDTFLTETSPFSVPTVGGYMKNLTVQIPVFIYKRKNTCVIYVIWETQLKTKSPPNPENLSTMIEEKENNVIIE